jgi:sulfur carrier protein ThiS
MKIRVTVSPPLVRYASGSCEAGTDGEWELPEDMTLAEIISRLGFPAELEIATVVNHTCCIERDRTIRDGDSVEVLPLISGG